jgi:MFS family permease
MRALRWIGANRWYLLAILTLITATQSLDRYILIVAIEPVKHEFGASDAAMGSLAGLLFSLAYCITALPLGFLADRLTRVRLFAALLFVWAGCTALGALARQFATLVLARVFVGAAESGASPISGSMIADRFKPSERAGPLGVMLLGSGLGAGLAFLIGALVIGQFGWRGAFLVAGAPGMALALILLFTVHEPIRGGLEGAAPDTPPRQGWGSDLAFVLTAPRYWLLCLGYSLAAFTSSAYSTWVISLLIRGHWMPIRQAGLVGAVGFGLVTALGGAIIAHFAQRLGRNGSEKLAFTAALCTAVICCLGVLMIFSGVLGVSLILFFLSCVSLTGWSAPTYAMVLDVVPASSRAVALSIMTMIGNVTAGLGPAVVGVLSDRLSGANALGQALSIVLLVDLLAAATYLAVAADIISRRRSARKSQAPMEG